MGGLEHSSARWICDRCSIDPSELTMNANHVPTQHYRDFSVIFD
jgi:hypothetical protein